MQSYHKSRESHRDFSSRFLQLDLVETHTSHNKTRRDFYN